MSRKTAVLDSNAPENSAPTTFVKQSVADLLVRRLLADRISKHLIRRRPAAFSPVKPSALLAHPAAFRYVPDVLPAQELPGLKFQLPLASRILQSESMVAGFRKLRTANF